MAREARRKFLQVKTIYKGRFSVFGGVWKISEGFTRTDSQGFGGRKIFQKNLQGLIHKVFGSQKKICHKGGGMFNILVLGKGGMIPSPAPPTIISFRKVALARLPR